MTASSASGQRIPREEMESRGITEIRDGKEIIVKDGVEYEETSGWGWGKGFARTDGYGMSGNGEKPTLDKVLYNSLDDTSYNLIDSMNFGTSRDGAREKYAQLEDVARGQINGTSFTAADIMNTAVKAGPEYLNYDKKGRATSWKTERLSDRTTHLGGNSVSHGGNYQDGRMQLIHDLGSSAKTQIDNSLQKQAKKWLAENPNRAGQKGWRFNGKKWVQTGSR